MPYVIANYSPPMQDRINEIFDLDNTYARRINGRRDIIDKIIAILKSLCDDDEICKQFDTINCRHIYYQLEERDDRYPIDQIIDICYHKCMFDAALFVIRLCKSSDGNLDGWCLFDCIDRSDIDSVKILFERFVLPDEIEEQALDFAIDKHDLGIIELIFERYPSSIRFIQNYLDKIDDYYLDKIDDDEEMKEYLTHIWRTQ